MSDRRDGEQRGTKVPAESAESAERFVYLMSEQMVHGNAEDQIDLRELWDIVWTGKWQIVAVTILFAAASIAYALIATEWYRAEVLLVPAEEKSTPSLGGQLGGLAALAGVSVGASDSVEAVATLKSREFAREFIEDYGLLPIFFADDWDAENQRWVADDPSKIPDIRDAVSFFHEEVLSVSEDRKTYLVTLAVQWKDPEIAAAWAAVLAGRLNLRLRERALRDAETNVEYLQQQLAGTNVVTLQQAIGRLLENELQKLMLARGNTDFAFRIIDSAYPPKERAHPNRKLIAALGTAAGGMLGLAWVFVTHLTRSRDQKISA